MKIIVDAMGGDNAPDEIIAGALAAVREDKIEAILVGRGEDILRSIERMGLKELPRGVEIANASEVIGIEEDPVNAIREKKDASIVVALNLLRDGVGDAMVSAGSTGAILSGATLIVKRVRGLRRAALAPVIPNSYGGFLLIDCGANVECTAEYLLQFAFMGSYYAQDVLNLESPRVGLLSNGTERTKGTQLQQEAYELLEKAGLDGHINFVGNVEAKAALIHGACDVLVCDGFTGNVVLKSLEGAAKYVSTEVEKIYETNFITKISGFMIKKYMRGLKAKIDSDKVGGTVMLGIAKPVIKAHGASSAAAIHGAMRQAAIAAEADTASKLQANVDKMKLDDIEN